LGCYPRGKKGSWAAARLFSIRMDFGTRAFGRVPQRQVQVGHFILDDEAWGCPHSTNTGADKGTITFSSSWQSGRMVIVRIRSFASAAGGRPVRGTGPSVSFTPSGPSTSPQRAFSGFYNHRIYGTRRRSRELKGKAARLGGGGGGRRKDGSKFGLQSPGNPATTRSGRAPKNVPLGLGIEVELRLCRRRSPGFKHTPNVTACQTVSVSSACVSWAGVTPRGRPGSVRATACPSARTTPRVDHSDLTGAEAAGSSEPGQSFLGGREPAQQPFRGGRVTIRPECPQHLWARSTKAHGSRERRKVPWPGGRTG